MRWYQTTRDRGWQQITYSGGPEGQPLTLGQAEQRIEGFGGCFNELGWMALSRLPEGDREAVLDLLFGQEGLGLNYCRVPIGASDYAAGWYSLDETPDDYALEHFSIERDRQHLLPYIRAALERNPSLRLFASPWSPPTWMKVRPVYNTGAPLRWEEPVLRAYARYFCRFIRAYAEEGVHIDLVYPQNEPVAVQNFPSCIWTAAMLAEFIGRYLGPALEQAGLDAAIGLGTLNAPISPMGMMGGGNELGLTPLNTGYADYVQRVMQDPQAARYVRAIGLQWASKAFIQQARESYPELLLMQTENECGDGRNSWEYARYVFDLFRHYLSNGASVYCYWNMALEEGGVSAWGWRQNAMVSVLPGERRYRLEHECHVMRHFSALVRPGARRLQLRGHWAGNAVAFRNPDGEVVLVIHNPLEWPSAVSLEVDGQRHNLLLAPDSINSIAL